MGLSEPAKAARKAFLAELDRDEVEVMERWAKELDLKGDEVSSEKAAYWLNGGAVDASETGNTIFQWTYRDQNYPRV